MPFHKGIEIDEKLVGLLGHMDELDATRESLQSLQGVWDTLALLGQLSGNGVEIDAVRGGFADLTTRLVNQLGHEARDKAARALRATAQVAIDILVRNLYERTADIGFLATDDDLRRFAGAAAADREPLRAALAERLREYQRKYTVYDDIVLLAPDGTLLARLDGTVAGERSADPLVAEALHSDTAFVERYRATDLRPGSAPALVYASRMTAPAATARGGPRHVGVLCLCFDFADECRRIFDGLSGGADDWRVVTLLDAAGCVLATSDAQQVPPGARLELLPHGEGRLLRFAGRRWLATSCDATAYQGYAGPGWRGHVMVPLEHAFGADAAASPGGAGMADVALIDSLRDSPRLFPPALRAIPQAAERIESALTRTVWNGNVALGAGSTGALAAAKVRSDALAAEAAKTGTHASTAAGAEATAGSASAAANAPGGSHDTAFAKTLLREVARTGARTRQVFTQAIGQLNRTVLSTLLGDQAACATLAIDILDRNRYERANDCRWWALTGAFRDALHTATTPDAACVAALTRVLQTIHGLYTVYANLLLFDRHGRIVAVSRADADGSAAMVGQPLNGEWVRRTLALADPQGYVVSDFEASPLYGGRPTWVYAAAVRAPAAAGGAAGNVGGLAIVFDAAPQLDAMLADTLPRDAAGQPKAGCFNVFVDGGGRVLASSRAELAVGASLPLDALRGSPGQSAATAHGRRSSSAGQKNHATIVRFDGGVYTVGACRSTGYREFEGATGTAHPARADVTALSLLLLATAAELAPAAPASSLRRFAGVPAPAATTSGGADRLDLATFSIGGQWYGLPGHDVEEALEAPHVLPLPGMQPHVRGSVMRNGEPVAVLDLGARLGRPARSPASPETTTGQRPTPAPRQVVIVRPGKLRPRFGVLVEALGDNPEVARSRLDDARSVCGPSAGGESALIEHLVKPPHGEAPGQDILMLLSADRLGALLLAA